VRAAVGEITEGAPTLVIGKRQHGPPGSRNLPIKSWANIYLRRRQLRPSHDFRDKEGFPPCKSPGDYD
jgi:hypothetical protein